MKKRVLALLEELKTDNEIKLLAGEKKLVDAVGNSAVPDISALRRSVQGYKDKARDISNAIKWVREVPKEIK
jgi:hypothetical protein